MPRKQVSPINEDFDIKLFVTIARKNAWWFLGFLAISALIAYLTLRYTAPEYEAATIVKLSVENKASNVLDRVHKADEFSYDNSKIAGDIELIRSKIVIERAINTLPLTVSYYSQGTVLEFELYKQSPFIIEYVIKDSIVFGERFVIDFPDDHTISLNYPLGSSKRANKSFEVNKWFSTPLVDIRVSIVDYKAIKEHQEEFKKSAYFFILNTKSTVTEQIISKLNVTPLNLDARTILIKLRGKNGYKVADITQTISAEFIKYDVEKSSEATSKILDFIDKTIESINIQLSLSESSLEQFKRSNKIISPDLAVSDVTIKIESIRKELEIVNYELDLYRQISKDIDQQNDLSKFVLSISGTANDNAVLAQLEKLKTMLDERDIIQTQTTTSSDIYKIISQKIINQKELVKRTISNEEAQLIIKQRALVARTKEYDVKFGRIPSQQAEYGRLQRFFNINEKFYSLLLEKKAEFSITKAGYVPQHIILQEAKYNSPPVSPNRSLIISACFMLGFLASLVLIVTRYLLYNEINALEEIGMYTDAALLGIIPKYKREIPVSQLLVDKNPKSVISEAFRSVRTNLQFISNEKGPKLMVVTSTISGEGKTFIAINLAGVLAFSGKKVVILDLDMRKPKIHIGFNVENNHGMSTILIGKDNAEECIMHSSLPNLDFITAGPIPPNPAELIIGLGMDQLIEDLKKKYDIIICDTPPIGIVTDGISVIQKADYPLYILRANYSRKMFIVQVNKLMNENKIKNISIVLNGVELSRVKYGYGYGYSYGYGYGYGYSYGYGYYDEDEKPGNIITRLRKLVSKNK